MEESSSSSCFICGVNVVGGGGGNVIRKGGRGRLRKSCNFENLKEFLKRLCELLSVKVTDEDLDYLEDLQEQQSVCCGKCYEIMKNVDKLQDIILRSQQELKEHLDQVESLIVKSEQSKDLLQSSLWSRSCFDLRSSVLKKAEVISKSNVAIKKEPEVEETDFHEDGHSLDDDWNSMDLGDGTPEMETSSMASGALKPEMTEDDGLKDLMAKAERLLLETEKDAEQKKKPANFSKKKTALSLSRKRKKRNNSDDDDEDYEGTLDFQNFNKRLSERSAKKNAENMLKNYAKDLSDDDDERKSDDDGDEDYDNSANDIDNYEDGQSRGPEAQEEENDSGESEDDDDGGDGGDISNAEDNSNSNQMTATQQQTSSYIKEAYNPYLVTGENMFLYRWSTFVRKTHTHLQCQAHHCSFETEWDFFVSFQEMKYHLESQHHTIKYRQESPHPCLLCDTLLDNREEFLLHIKQSHSQQFGLNAQAICECCLMIMHPSSLNTHHFTHKSEEEKALTLSGREIPLKEYRKKKDEGQEFVCDYLSCEMSFKKADYLKRHKLTHLKKDSSNPNMTSCPECGQKITKGKLELHIQRIHHPENAKKVLICPMCDKRYLTCDRSVYEAHIRRHKGERPFVCSLCGKSFAAKENLTKHTREVHNQQDPIPCEWCDQIYRKRDSWRTHMKKKHPDKYKDPLGKRKPSKFYTQE